jgi:hypothetical protein
MVLPKAFWDNISAQNDEMADVVAGLGNPDILTISDLPRSAALTGAKILEKYDARGTLLRDWLILRSDRRRRRPISC